MRKDFTSKRSNRKNPEMEESEDNTMKTAHGTADEQQARDVFDMQKANQFLNCHRGRYIIGRALYETYLKVKDEEPSDAADMKFLGETLFQIGWLSASVMRDKSVLKQMEDLRKHIKTAGKRKTKIGKA